MNHFLDLLGVLRIYTLRVFDGRLNLIWPCKLIVYYFLGLIHSTLFLSRILSCIIPKSFQVLLPNNTAFDR